MRGHIFVLGLLCCFAGLTLVWAQNQRPPIRPAYPSEAAREAYQKGNYLAPLIEFREKRKELLDPSAKSGAVNNIPLRGLYLQTYGSFSAEVGNYREALEAFDEDESTAPSPFKDAEAQREELSQCQPLEAVEVVKGLAETHQAIFINEAHHVPQHRAFTLSLLRALWDKGFRYFAAETLNPADKELSQRGYPARSKTGYYTNEPVYGDLIRAAVKLGYKIIPYEYEGTPQSKSDEKLSFQQQRDKGEAQNLYDRVFKNDPTAKIIVHAGYAHVYEKATASWYPMALYFRELTGINPLTIDQTEMSERGGPKLENAVYKFAIDKWKLTKPTIFRSADGNFFVGGTLKGFVDLQVFSPRSEYRDGRPTWLLLNGLRAYHQVSIGDLKPDFPYLVQAFLASEGDDAVPVDQIEVQAPSKKVALVLPKGSVVIKLKNRIGEVVRTSRVNVK